MNSFSTSLIKKRGNRKFSLFFVFLLCSIFRIEAQYSNSSVSEIDRSIPQESSAASISSAKVQIIGVVVDNDGQSVIGASVFIKNSSKGTITDYDGKFNLEVSPGATLIVSYIGYITREFKIDASTDFRIVIQEDSKALDEVVVIGYGTQKKQQVTSSIEKLNMDQVASRNVSSANQLLQGGLAGVNASSSNGTPGGKSRVSIRGVSSINGDNEPLYVIDGIPISKASASYNYSGEFVQDPLSLINTSDVESIDVLKDAAATAIYGSRGANGVVIINTKKGKDGAPKFSFSHLSGVLTMPKKLNLLSSQQYIDLQREAVNNFNGDYGYSSESKGFVSIDKVLGKVPTNLVDIAWQDRIIRKTATSTQTDFSVSGGNDKTTYFNSIGYMNQQGMIEKSSLGRFSFRSNVGYKPNNSFDLGFNLAGNFTKSTSVPNGAQGTALFQRSLEQRPYDSPYLPDGSFAVGGKDILRHNGVMILDKDHTRDENYQALINFFAAYHITNELTFRTSYNSELRVGHGHRRQEIGHPYNGSKGWINDSRNNRYSQTFDNTLSYDNVFGDFSVNALLGHSFYSDAYDFNTITGREFPSDEFKHINAATTITGSEGLSKYAIESYFVRANLGYKAKYLLSTSVRRDGSSKFNAENRNDYFPSVSGAWIFTKESFMEDVRFFNNGKLRLSWGKTGNQDGIGNYDYLALAQGGANYDGTTGLTVTSIGNKDLKWEVNTQSNLGLDLSFLRGRLNISYDYFIKRSDNLLYNVPTLETSGFPSMTKNIGNMVNRGHEISLQSKNIVGGEFEWFSNLNMSFIKNKVTRLLGNEPIEVGGWSAIVEGQPLGVFWGFEHNGIYQTKDEVPESLYNQGVRPGDIRFVDVDSNGKIDTKDKKVIGTPYPALFGGLTNNFKYKGFDLSLLITFSLGNDIASAWRTGLDHLGGTDYNNIAESYNKRWVGEGTSNWTPRATKGNWNTRGSSYYIEDGSYIRLKNITLGYNLLNSFTKNIGFDSIRFYASISNLLTVSSYSGYDPEAASGTDARSFGIDNLVTPQSRSFLIGVNLNF